MKNYFLLLIILLSLTISVKAQDKPKKFTRPTLAMNDLYIDGLLGAMKNQYGDDGKLSVIKEGVKNNSDGITVAQELRLMNQFASDDAKLECAKFLYAWSVDYKNYDKIKYNLGTLASQKALADYIKKQR